MQKDCIEYARACGIFFRFCRELWLKTNLKGNNFLTGLKQLLVKILLEALYYTFNCIYLKTFQRQCLNNITIWIPPSRSHRQKLTKFPHAQATNMMLASHICGNPSACFNVPIFSSTLLVLGAINRVVCNISLWTLMVHI